MRSMFQEELLFCQSEGVLQLIVFVRSSWIVIQSYLLLRDEIRRTVLISGVSLFVGFEAPGFWQRVWRAQLWMACGPATFAQAAGRSLLHKQHRSESANENSGQKCDQLVYICLLCFWNVSDVWTHSAKQSPSRNSQHENKKQSFRRGFPGTGHPGYPWLHWRCISVGSLGTYLICWHV